MSVNAKFTAKLIFRLCVLCYHCWCWHSKSKASPHFILKVHVFGPPAGGIWTKSYVVQLYKILSFLPKKKRKRREKKRLSHHFRQSFDAILDEVSVTQTIIWSQTIDLKTIIFQCCKYYDTCSLTRVTCLKLHQASLTMSDLLSHKNRP